jgi:hypothetical protein
MALPDLLKIDMGGISPLIDAARAPKETPQSLVKTPAAPKFGENDVGTMEGMLSAGRSRLANFQTQETSFSTEKANLTSRLANLTSEQLAYNRQKEEFGAKQRVEESRANYDNIKKIFDDEINSPQYKEKQRINKEIAEYQVFAPTEVTAPMLGVLFAAIGATGMLLGGNSKNNAKAALSAMNGMAEGFGEGRRQYDKERKAAFDTNVKLLQTKLSAIKDGLEDARREAVLNKQAADQKVRETLAVNEAQFLQENTNKRGLESTIALVNGQLANINQATNLLSSKISQLTGQLDSKETQILMRKIDAASRESEKRIAAEQRQKELEQRQKKLTPVGMQGDNIVMSDELGNITLVPTGEGFVPKAGIQPRPEPRTPAPRTGKGEGKGQPSSGAGGAVQFRYNSAMVNAGNQLAIEVANAADLPALAAPPAFAEVLTNPSKGLTDAGRAFFSQKITQPESRAMQQVFAGMQRAMTTIEASGRPSGATEAAIKEFGKTLPRAGDNKINTYLFLAQTRQVMEILEKDLKAAGATDEQIKQAIEARREVENVISWTVKDVNRILSKDGARLVDDRTRDLMKNSQTLGEFNSELRKKPSEGTPSPQVAKPGEGWSDKDERRLQELEEKARGSQPK